MNEPTFTFYNKKAYVNTLCLRELSEYHFIKLLINPQEKILAVLPCSSQEKDSLPWCMSGKKRIPRHISCKIFSAKVFSLMKWNPDYRYRLPGQLKIYDNIRIYLFDLNTPEIYVPGSNKVLYETPYSASSGLCSNSFKGYTVFGLKENT